MGMEVSVYCGTRDVMRPVFIRHGEKRLRIVARRTYERAHNLGRCLVLNCDGVRDMLLAYETEGDIRTARVDVVPPKRRKSVGVIVPGVPVITNTKQSTLQKPYDGSGHDPGAERLLAIASEVVRHLPA
jgi:hypothetical protein